MRNVVLILFLTWSANGFCQVADFPDTDFRKCDSIAQAYAGQDLRHPDKLTQTLVQDLTADAEKFRVIFRWITDNIAYDYPLYLKKAKKREALRYKRKKYEAFEARAGKRTYRRMIIRKKTICSGYATLLNYMCEQAGLSSTIIEGYARTFNLENWRGPNHAWNAVRLNNRWYLCDATWASGEPDPETGKFNKSFNEIYFLTDPSLLIANHYPTDKSWTLQQDPPSLSQFMQAPLKAEGFIVNWINQYSPDKGSVRVKKEEPFELQFTSNATTILANASLYIVNASKRKDTQYARCQLTRNETGAYILKHTFQKPGRYRLYVTINRELTFVYTVAVS